MKIGLQTISWGLPVKNIEILIQGAKDIGYQGLEFSQPPEFLGDPLLLRRTMERHGLEIIGFAGGDLEKRSEYSLELLPYYLYVDEWNEKAIEAATAKGAKVGLHPHYYKSIDTIQVAEHYLYNNNNLGLIIDTAHLFLSGDDVLEGLRKHIKRIHAVHLKDWTPEYGRSPFHFALGFTVLGRGVVSNIIRDAVFFLMQNEYTGWAIVEQDVAHHADPLVCAKESWVWLQNELKSSAERLEIK